jgi:hypothetical protein
MQREVISTYIESDVAAELRARARDADRTLSSELRRCVRIALGAEEPVGKTDGEP